MLGKKNITNNPPKSWDFFKGMILEALENSSFGHHFLFGNLSPPKLKQVSPACVFIMTFCRPNVGNGQSFVPFLG